MSRLTHTDSDGRARMVDVGGKETVKRVAVARGSVTMEPDTVRLIGDNLMKKGDVLTVAEIAGIGAAKKSAELIPLCHNIALDNVTVKAVTTEEGVDVEATVRCPGRTGVEMEALTAVSVALLTVYDMCKAVDKGMVIGGIELISKEKG